MYFQQEMPKKPLRSVVKNYKKIKTYLPHYNAANKNN